MVGYMQNTNSEEQEEKENFANPSLSLAGFEELSLSYADSFLDFDYIKDWIEANPEPFKSVESDLGGSPFGFSSEKVAYQVFDKSPEMDSAGIDEKIKVEEGLVGEEGEKLGSLDPEKIECLGSEKGGEMEKIKVEEGIEGDNCLVSVVGCMSGIQGGGEDCGNGNDEGVGGCDVVKGVEAANVIGRGMESGVLVSLGPGIASTSEMTSLDSIQGKSGNKGGDGDEGDSDSNSESESDSDSDMESESDSDSESSSSSSSSSSDEEEGDEKAKGGNGGQERKRQEMDMEEGEIVASDPEEMVAWSGDEYDEDDCTNGVATMGPSRSKNELAVLPPVPPVNVTLQPHHEIQPVGVVLSVLGAQVIVEGVEKHNPLNEGSILWITDSRSPLGLVDEIFGPVRNPYYIVRYNSESEVPAGIQPGSSVAFVPEFANHVLNDKSLYTKGYDASGANDEELLEEDEFSDDEKEAEHRKMLKNKKRGTNDEKVGNKKKDEKRSGNWSRNSKCDSTFNRHIPMERAKLQVDQSGLHVPPSVAPLHQGNQLPSPGLGQGLHSQPGLARPLAQLASNSGLSATGAPLVHGNESCSLGLGQTLAYQPGLASPFAQLTLNSGFGASSSGTNAIPFQLPQCVGLPQLPTNSMHWVQQINQLYQMPSQNRFPVQQQINAAPILPSNLVFSGSQSGFGKEPALLSWPASLGQNTFSSPPFGMATPGQQASLPINVREQSAPSNISETSHNDGSRQHTSFSGELDTFQRFSYGGGRKANSRGGGRFRGGRGRQHRGRG